MLIAGTMPCSFVNGPGIRYVIFCQGCPHHCPGCHNPSTWSLIGGHEVSVESLADDIVSRWAISGITLSGGEPFIQQDECVKLIKLVKDARKDLNVWIYTGFTYEEIKDTELAKLADFIVDGKFEQDKLVTTEYYGSSNQRIINVKKGTIEVYAEL